MRYFSIPGSLLRFTPYNKEAHILQAVEFDHEGCLDTEELVKLGLLSEQDAQALDEHLAPIADRPGSGVRTKSDTDVDAEVRSRMASEMRAAAEAAHRKMVAAGEKTA